ncbi:MAG: exodeoxyribonuclease V subunit gamma [Sedimenticola sp.]|nr:exodeoxyribonuclease V subunit gamma [Sedimenticola sp.]
MLYLYHSNRLEQLAERLAGVLAQPLDDPLATETVVVQHPGMERWLSLQLAHRLGVCANMAFPLPAGYIWQLLRQLLDGVPDQDRYQPALMQWWLFQRLDGPLDPSWCAPLKQYLEGADELMRFQLAGEIARTFDQYLVYRPDWIVGWQLGRCMVPGDEWQGALWRELATAQPDDHWVDLQQRLEAECPQPDPNALPQRVCLFALSSLSPGYLGILQYAARQMDVHLFLLNPAQGHWMDLVSSREQQRQELAAPELSRYLDTGNPLLASMGTQGRDFFSLLLSFDPGSEELFVDPAGNRLLAGLQRDILYPDLEPGPEPGVIDPGDRSLQLHVCHSPMRELEVLHDQLLSRLEQDHNLSPDEILVMTPDMDLYAPYIEAVFGQTADGTTIPYSLSDSSQLRESPVVVRFLELLSLPGGRYPADRVVSLLELPALQRRFGLGEGDLPRIRHWIEQVAIRWGRDGTEREALGLPLTGQNSWQSGLDRLLLGYALPSEESLFRGILPCSEVEGADVRILGGLHAFVTALFELETTLLEAHTPVVWADLLGRLVARFLDPDEEEMRQVQALHNAIARLLDSAAMARFRGTLSRELVISQLESRFSHPSSGRFLGGGVNFCALTPMRALPFKVICMIGMNDGAYPRDSRRLGFDLIQREGYRVGDRSRRSDDRYLFLETLISAREQLYISYVGQDIRDNSMLPPSVLVSELLDVVDSCYCSASGESASQSLTTLHPLQPFNPRYFIPDSGLFSYSETHCAGAAALLGETCQRPPLLRQPLTRPETEWQQVELAQLISFFSHPVRYLLSQRIGITLPRGEDVLQGREPFELDYFGRSDLFLRLVAGIQAGHPRQVMLELERARGLLPHGVAGDVHFDRLYAAARKCAVMLSEQKMDLPTDLSPPIDWSHGSLRLKGRLEQVSSEGLVGYSKERIPDRQLLALWIRHLALNLDPPAGVNPVSRWLSKDGLLTFGAQAEAAQHMGTLLELYLEGLQTPLKLFPRSSHCFARALLDGKPADKALEKARGRWLGGYATHAEFDDPYYRLAFPDGEVLDEMFQSLSERVYMPMLSALESS